MLGCKWISCSCRAYYQLSYALLGLRFGYHLRKLWPIKGCALLALRWWNVVARHFHRKPGINVIDKVCVVTSELYCWFPALIWTLWFVIWTQYEGVMAVWSCSALWLRVNVRTSRVRTIRTAANRRYSRRRCACCKRIARIAQAQCSYSITNLM